VVNSETGVYKSNVPSPTGIPSDPALAGYGALQAKELAEKLITLNPPIEKFISSPFYRCIQTLYPTLDRLAALHPSSPEPKIYGENGLGEWYGTARFDHPSPASPELLKKLFPRYDVTYEPAIIPSTKGETIDGLHDRAAYTLDRIIEQCDQEDVRAIVICTHAATLYAIGRALTGRMPKDVAEEDFRPFTCGISKFVRRSMATMRNENTQPLELWKGQGTPIPKIEWRGGKGVGGGWDCVVNGDCSHLSGGEERGWYVCPKYIYTFSRLEGVLIGKQEIFGR
jgi:transcription factor C subunit 7